MDGTATMQYVCRKVTDVDCYREKPKDKRKPKRKRYWELVHPAYMVVDVFEGLVLYVGTETEALAQMHLYQQASARKMNRLRQKIRKHLKEIGPQKETCRGTQTEASGKQWRGLRPQK